MRALHNKARHTGMKGWDMVQAELRGARVAARRKADAPPADPKLDAFWDRVFGADTGGLSSLARSVRAYRLERARNLRDKTERRLQERGVSETQPVAPRLGVPLVEEATLADADQLLERWSSMLANAMDPGRAGSVRRSYVSILAELEPSDAEALDVIVREYAALSPHNRGRALFRRDSLAKRLKATREDCELSLRNLMRLGLVKAGVLSAGAGESGRMISSYQDTEMVAVTLTGLAFHRAIS